MLEPRRLAARRYRAYGRNLSEKVGQTVGYRVRGVQKQATQQRSRLLPRAFLLDQSDPELQGISHHFDEFHERSLNADLGLALSLEIRDALRNDLRIVVMSATLDAEPVQN